MKDVQGPEVLKSMALDNVDGAHGNCDESKCKDFMFHKLSRFQSFRIPRFRKIHAFCILRFEFGTKTFNLSGPVVANLDS